MNHTQPYMDVHSHMSSAQPYPSQAATSGTMSHYPYQHQPPVLQPASTYAPVTYQQYAYPNPVTSPPSAHAPPASSLGGQMPTQLLPLPQGEWAGQVFPPALLPPQRVKDEIVNVESVVSAASNHSSATPSGYGNTTGSPMQGYVYDPTGQVAPPGAKPRVTATLWEDEGSLCYQVEAKGVCVARREDNHMINGTKLLNVAGMTRGRRDGILKSEKLRHVVKIGPMHLKGVWYVYGSKFENEWEGQGERTGANLATWFRIPFERALEFANKEKITDLLYPLFVHNIGGLLYHPANQNRTNMVVQESQHRRMEGPPSGPQRTTPTAPQHSSLHHQAMQTPMSSHMSQPSSIGGGSRPGLERANTFPTPPASASSLIGVTNQNSSYEWGGSVPHTQPLSIDTALSNQRSMPTTPATTPPGNNMHGIPPYQAQSGYDSKPYYSAAPQSHSQYAPQTPMTQSGVSSYGQPLPNVNSYLKNEMAPPGSRTADHESSDLKNDRYAQGSGSDRYGQDASAESVQDQESEYLQDQSSTYNNRGSYTYTTNPSAAALSGEHSQLTPEMTGSPQQNGSGRMTPRTSISGPAPHWASGYNTPPRPPLAPSLYNAVSDTRGTPANGGSDPYSMASASAPVYSTAMGGSMGSGNKRMRDDDDAVRADPTNEYESKRRKTITENPLGGPLGGAPLLQPMKTGGPVARRR
ncbi:Cell pattern formation-associated protein stuA [Penicillium oxalicum]|uniref:Cell pattern formation-associated protein stuA n=1 Tax=Penicillium oxalicum TaxID=69781 RepID=UPI0020B7D3DC|nr:Cell pattern formation-associated protein stuA [Penicillium oxalicum]KAI2787822.1 Cell pattern formation-associated protein stuA [Penicillium oxalicum]